jgi:transcriptional regulator with XRE-family HTH domain
MWDDIDEKALRGIIRRNTRLALEGRGWNQSDLARELGVVRQRVNYILGNESYHPTLVHMIRISRALGVAIDWIIDPEATWPPTDRPAPTPATAPVMTTEPVANLTNAQRLLLDMARFIEVEAGEDPDKLRVSLLILMQNRPRVET